MSLGLFFFCMVFSSVIMMVRFSAFVPDIKKTFPSTQDEKVRGTTWFDGMVRHPTLIHHHHDASLNAGHGRVYWGLLFGLPLRSDLLYLLWHRGPTIPGSLQSSEDRYCLHHCVSNLQLPYHYTIQKMPCKAFFMGKSKYVVYTKMHENNVTRHM